MNEKNLAEIMDSVCQLVNIVFQHYEIPGTLVKSTDCIPCIELGEYKYEATQLTEDGNVLVIEYEGVKITFSYSIQESPTVFIRAMVGDKVLHMSAA